MRITFFAVLMGLACSPVVATPLRTESVRVTGPTIVAFVPYAFKNSNDDGAIEGAAHLRFAVEDTIKCLHPKKVVVHLVYADVVSLKGQSFTQRLAAHKLGQAVGAVLVEPDRKGEVVFSTDGPSTLLFLLPQAAAKYWKATACQQ